MEHPIYELKISENIDDNAEVSTIAFVDFPAIKRDFLQFVEVGTNEKKDEFLPRCISYVINEGKESEQAVAICNSMWEQHFAGEKISFDYDDTLSTLPGKELAKKEIAAGNEVYIISARQDKEGMLATAKELGISENKVYATGSNKAKVEKIKKLGITKHYDNNSDVIKELGTIGSKFNLMLNFAIQNEDKRIVTGALMIPDQLIYRKSEKFGEHYVKFSADTIKDISIKFAKKGFQKNVNLMHDENLTVEGVTMFESFLSDKSRGIAPIAAFSDLPDGTWFGSFFVENNEVWQLIKENKVKGFSVEGMFDYVQPLSQDQQKLQEFKKLMDTF